MATYTVNLFTTLDGFGTGPVAYWGKDGPELREWHARTFFCRVDQALVFRANTYRMMAHYAAQLADDPNFVSLSAAPARQEHPGKGQVVGQLGAGVVEHDGDASAWG